MFNTIPGPHQLYIAKCPLGKETKLSPVKTILSRRKEWKKEEIIVAMKPQPQIIKQSKPEKPKKIFHFKFNV